MSEYGSVLYDLGDLAGARTLYEQVRDAQIRALGPDHRDALATQDSLALVYWRLGRPREACAILEQIRDTLIKNYGPDDEQTVTTLEDLSAVYDEVGRGAEAIKLAQSVRAAQLKRYGAEHPRAIGALQNLAVRYQNNMKMRQALALYEEARNAIVPKLGVEHPTSLRILDSLARSYRAFNRTTEAIALAEQVRDARVLLLGAYHPDTIYSMHNLGSAYQAAGQMDKAWAAFQQAAAGLERKQFVHAAGSYIVWSVCDYLEQHRRFDEADQWRQKWLAAVSKRDGADSIDYASELARQGENMLRNRRDVAAEPLLRASVAILQKGEPEGTTIAFAQSLLGDDLARQKRFAEAEPLLIQGYEQLKARSNQLEPLYARYRITEAGQRIVQLYEAWGRPEKADQWRKKVLAPPTHPPKSND
jgi:tetratricopeptide (TPR) repeat protein